ncbi:putative hydrolase of the HAD superfamily [Gillisia sp. Hel_I_86]|uniref:HAD family hydrolase n=1 Tax=Gillisia sp. Hel_I_86 TaxID=1249981 RepID=UPI00119AA09E|nr:HAD family phosphatase [Gillisia sp. Hel_I_86]TVZ25375.1 putative hydrolase of the HAD superfamily [Gillisia sp. Hel_I_86]
MIKTIIFDFGDVFINLDKPATFRELKKLNIKELPENILHINKEYEMGLVSTESFIASYIDNYSSLTSERMTTAWNSILMDFPKYRYQFIKKLSSAKNYQLILLSNTNEIHIDWVKEKIPFFEEFKACFDAFYLSHEINLRKPNSDIFEFVLNKHQLKAEECLFIDDTLENTKAAEKLGIHIWTLEPTREDVIDLFTTNKALF